MANDIFSSILGYLQMGTGNDPNNWGVLANNNVFQIFENAIAGQLSQTVNGGTLDLSANPPPAGASQAGFAILNFSGGLTAKQTVKLPNLSMRWIVFNNTTGAFALQLETATGNVTGTPITIPQGQAVQIWCDGNNNLRQITAGSIVSITQFGGTGDGATDNTPALNSAFAALPSQGGAIYFPAGKYAFAAGVTLSLPSATEMYDLTLFGDGLDASTLFWQAGGGLDVVYNNPSGPNGQSTHFRDLAFTTGAAGAGTALTLQQASTTDSTLSAGTEITRCAFRGDVPYVTQFWGNDLNLGGICNVNVNGCTFAGPSGSAGGGLLYSGLNAGNGATTLNVIGSIFNNKNIGLSIGSFTQGITVSQCTFANCVASVNASGSGATLAVSDSRFILQASSTAINCQAATVQVANCLFALASTATVASGILLNPAANFSVTGCIFIGPVGAANNSGVAVLGQQAATAGIISGNLFAGMSVGINIAAGVANVNVAPNQFIACTSPVTNAGAGTSFGLWRNDTAAGNFAAVIQNGLGGSTCDALAVRAGVYAASDTNTVMIGLFSGDGSNAVGSINRSGTGVLYLSSSDERLKTDFRPTSRGLDTLLQIPIEDFVWKSDPERRVVQGIVAQRLLPHCPEAVTIGGEDPSKEPWLADYGRLSPMLIRAVQELTARVAAVEAGAPRRRPPRTRASRRRKPS